MEYQQKKEQILTSVQYTNLLGFTLVQNKLQRNFKAIVQALLLNQTKNDQIAIKTDQLQDRLAILQKQKGTPDQEGLKQSIKQLNQRISKLESNPNQSKTIGRQQSSKNIRQIQKIQQSRKDILKNDNGGLGEKNSFLQKKIEDAFQQIIGLKQKIPTLKLMQNDVQNMKKQLTMLKGQLMTVGKSTKSLKRQSINLNSKPTFRRQSATKNGKSQNLSHSNSTVLLQDADNKQNKSIHLDIKQKLQTNASNVINCESEFDKQLQGLHIEVNTLNLCYQQVKNLVEDLRKKDIKYHNIITQLEDKQRRMQDQMRRDSQNFQRTLKGMKLDMLDQFNTLPKNGSKPTPSNQDTKQEKEQKEGKQGRKSSPSSGYRQDENTINYKNQINDKISKLQNSLLGFITQNEFNRFKTQTRSKIEQIQKKHAKLVQEYQQQIKKIYDMFINKDLDLNRLGQQLSQTGEIIKENHSQAQRKHNIAIARIQQLKKNLQNLRQDVQFYQAMNTDNKQSKDKKNDDSKITGSQGQSKIQKDSGVDPKALEDLKKYFNNKLHDQRAYLVGLIRDLEKKQNSASGVNQQIANLWDKINEINIFLSKKGDAEDTKKNLIYLEKKINKIGAQLVKADDNTQDARIARTNWFCLSCDKNLLGYQGKPGKHVVWDSMPLKGMIKGVDKKGLPSLKK